MQSTPVRELALRRLSIVLLAFALAAGIHPAAGEAQSADVAEAVVATVGPRQVLAAELDRLVADRLVKLRADEYALRRRALDDVVARILLELEAERRQMSMADLLRTEVDRRVRAITEDEARAVYESAPSRFPGLTAQQAAPQIRESLRQSRLAEARRQLTNEAREGTPVHILLEPPRVALDVRMGPARGPVDAAVTIVEFADFQCPYCREAAATLRRLEQMYSGRLRVVFRDFPLPNHTHAPKAAEAAHCADEQGHFWEMHDALFGSGTGLEVPDLKRRAVSLGLNAGQFDACLDSGKYADRWQRNRALGQQHGVSATPTFFVNGRMVTGALPYHAFNDIVAEELERSQRPPSPESAARGEPEPRP